MSPHLGRASPQTLQALSHTFELGLASLDHAAINFERVSAATELCVPAELRVEQVGLLLAVPASLKLQVLLQVLAWLIPQLLHCCGCSDSRAVLHSQCCSGESMTGCCSCLTGCDCNHCCRCFMRWLQPSHFLQNSTAPWMQGTEGTYHSSVALTALCQLPLAAAYACGCTCSQP